MNVFLMNRECEASPNADPIFGKNDLLNDLELDRILDSMAGGDSAVRDICSAALLHPLLSLEEIRYRQSSLRDALSFPQAVRSFYRAVVNAFEMKRNSWYWISAFPSVSTRYQEAVRLLDFYADVLRKLRGLADFYWDKFVSEGFGNLISMLRKELNDDYFREIRDLLFVLTHDSGILISASLGSHAQGVDYVLRQKESPRFWGGWLFAPVFTLAPRDDAGATDFSNRKDLALTDAADALTQAVEHIEGFLKKLRDETAFFVGCLNLRDALHSVGMATCFPSLHRGMEADRNWEGLYDVSLALLVDLPIIGNTHRSEGNLLHIVTGANQGGKTTFLRSVGQAQLMSQCGMFCGALAFYAPLRNGIFTHFKREEDHTMTKGKLDEELFRMSSIADHLVPESLILFNESFSSTNEREGSEIARQVTRALLEKGIEAFHVTHLFDFAESMRNFPKVEFLKAERFEDGTRSFRILPGKPESTAFGHDLYKEVFGGQVPDSEDETRKSNPVPPSSQAPK